jgi:hypothetical protein
MMKPMIDGITNKRLLGMIDLCDEEIPGFELTFKNESDWMKFLNLFAQLFNKGFMTRFTTTAGATVYIPSRQYLLDNQEAVAGVLAHELVHMKEAQKDGVVLMFLRNAFPQILAALALFALIALWSPWFLLALIFLLALLPLPSPSRRDVELRGYAMMMAIRYWTGGEFVEADYTFYANEFTGSAYYFMWPFRDDIMNRLKMKAIDIRTHAVLQDPLYRKVYNIYKS